MTTRETIYACFYGLSFFLAIIAGSKTGFTGTHTPPLPFGIEVLVLPIGAVIWIIDVCYHRPTRVHQVGFSVNALIMAIVLMLALGHF